MSFLVSTQMMPINDLMVEEDRNQFVPLIGRAQSEGSIDSSVTAKLITPQIIGHQPPWNIPVPFSAVLLLQFYIFQLGVYYGQVPLGYYFISYFLPISSSYFIIELPWQLIIPMSRRPVRHCKPCQIFIDLQGLGLALF